MEQHEHAAHLGVCVERRERVARTTPSARPTRLAESSPRLESSTTRRIGPQASAYQCRPARCGKRAKKRRSPARPPQYSWLPRARERRGCPRRGGARRGRRSAAHWRGDEPSKTRSPVMARNAGRSAAMAATTFSRSASFCSRQNSRRLVRWRSPTTTKRPARRRRAGGLPENGTAGGGARRRAPPARAPPARAPGGQGSGAEPWCEESRLQNAWVLGADAGGAGYPVPRPAAARRAEDEGDRGRRRHGPGVGEANRVPSAPAAPVAAVAALAAVASRAVPRPRRASGPPPLPPV